VWVPASAGTLRAEARSHTEPDQRFFDDEPFFLGTFAPDCRASDNPIAMACFRLVTFLPERLLLVHRALDLLAGFLTVLSARHP